MPSGRGVSIIHRCQKRSVTGQCGETLERNPPAVAILAQQSIAQQSIVGDESQSAPAASLLRNGQAGGTAPSVPGIRRAGSGGADVPHSTTCQ